MEPIQDDLSPLEPGGGERPPELRDEAYLLLQMSLSPMDPLAARSYARRKYSIYGLIIVACVGLPLAIFGATFLVQIGLPNWFAQLAVIALLLLFFVLFFAVIALNAAKSRVLKQLGFLPVDGGSGQAQVDVAMLAERKGRKLEYGVSPKGNFWRYCVPSPSFRVESRHGRFFASPELPRSIRDFLSSLPEDRLWKGLRIDGTAQGIQTSRPIRLAKYFLQDLWLLESMLNGLEKKQ